MKNALKLTIIIAFFGLASCDRNETVNPLSLKKVEHSKTDSLKISDDGEIIPPILLPNGPR